MNIRRVIFYVTWLSFITTIQSSKQLTKFKGIILPRKLKALPNGAADTFTIVDKVATPPSSSHSMPFQGLTTVLHPGVFLL